MTTYPLSEPATILPLEAGKNAASLAIGRGTLEECAGIVGDLPVDERQSIAIQMDDMDLRFDPEDVESLIRFLHNEEPGLTDKEIANIKS
ncbi:hypothetical protein [uncultured Sphingomonas sp.]|uniref:hypothetical protein n=1 Tax=uncultured Sphingomonas sp. TaxID=158754 RepID=UPI0035C98726